MKQIEIDSEIAGWFRKRELLAEAKRALNSAEVAFSNSTNNLAKKLLPANPKPEERWVFPTTDGKAVVAFLKKTQFFQEGLSAEDSARYDPTVEEHSLKPKP